MKKVELLIDTHTLQPSSTYVQFVYDDNYVILRYKGGGFHTIRTRKEQGQSVQSLFVWAVEIVYSSKEVL